MSSSEYGSLRNKFERVPPSMCSMQRIAVKLFIVLSKVSCPSRRTDESGTPSSFFFRRRRRPCYAALSLNFPPKLVTGTEPRLNRVTSIHTHKCRIATCIIEKKESEKEGKKKKNTRGSVSAGDRSKCSHIQS